MADALESPPVAKYRYTLVIDGNSHEEIEHELLVATRGGYLLDSGHHGRDEFRVVGGRKESVLEHTNPSMTDEKYHAELRAWADARKARRAAVSTSPDSGSDQ